MTNHFYLQSAWTEGRKLAVWLEWLKLGLVFIIPVSAPEPGNRDDTTGLPCDKLPVFNLPDD